jgi:hypothetical protein
MRKRGNLTPSHTLASEWSTTQREIRETARIVRADRQTGANAGCGVTVVIPVEGLEGLEHSATRVWAVKRETLQTLHYWPLPVTTVEGLEGLQLCHPHARAVGR